MKKALLVIISVIMAFTMTAAVVGCGKSDEQVIRKGISDELNQFKDVKSDIWKDTMAGITDTLANSGGDPEALITSWMDGFDYKIGAISVDGDKATVELTITCKQLYPALKAAQNTATNTPGVENMSVTDIQALLITEMSAELQNAIPVTSTVSVSYEKVNNEWSEVSGAEGEIVLALVGSMQ